MRNVIIRLLCEHVWINQYKGRIIKIYKCKKCEKNKV